MALVLFFGCLRDDDDIGFDGKLISFLWHSLYWSHMSEIECFVCVEWS